MSAKTPVVDKKEGEAYEFAYNLKVVPAGLARALEAHCEALAEILKDYAPDTEEPITALNAYEQWKREQLGK